MPGVGKTALAVRAARLISGRLSGRDALPQPSFRRSRDALSLDPAEALHRLLRMMSVPATQIPDTVGDRVALWRAQLSRRRAIVILDDAARPDQIRPLLPASGRCLILITTRRRLADLGSVRTLTLDVLAADDAVTLFRQIAGEDRARDSDQVAEVVRLCGRLPLAIQLTAGRVAQDPRLGLADLIEELSQSPARLGGVGAACPEVMSAFDLSYRRAGARSSAVLPAAGRQPVRLGQPAGRGRPGRLHPGRGGEGPGHPARLPPADPGPRRPVPLPRPDPRVRGRARRPG